MNAKRIVLVWGILTLSLSALALSGCGGSAIVPAPEDPGVTQESGPEEVAPEPEVEPEPEVLVDCTEDGICEAGHECSVNAECGSKKCELTVGLCIESCNAGFTFWTSNGSEAGTCIPTPPPHPVEGWM